MDPTAQQSTRPMQQPVPSAPATDMTVPPPPVGGSKSVASVSTHPEQGPRAVEAPPAESEHADVAAEPTHPELTVGPELQEAGVEHGSDAKQEKLSEEVKDAGVTLAKEATPVVPNAQPTIPLPLTQPEALIAKKQSVKSSVRWLAEKVIYFLKQQGQYNPK